MLARNIMLKEFPSLTLQDHTEQLSELAFEYDIFHVPIVHKGRYLGLFAFDLLNDLDILEDKTLEHYQGDLILTSVQETDYIFDTFKAISDRELTAIAVVNQEMEFTGLIRTIDVIKYLTKTLSLQEDGAFITLEMDSRDYNLQEIARIVESNNAKILSLHLDEAPKQKLWVTIKVNRTGLTHIIATFERFDYLMLGHSGELGRNDALLDRYELLMKMLNI